MSIGANIRVYKNGIPSTQDPRQFRKLYCGKELNRGTTRKVYEYLPDKRYVVKIEYTRSFINVVEWEIWLELDTDDRYKDIKKYFAECLFISKNGRILVQRKVKHKKRKNSYPQQIPHFFNDCKITNYGWIGKRFVCCDYGNFSLVKGFTKRMKKAEWWQLGPNRFKMK